MELMSLGFLSLLLFFGGEAGLPLGLPPAPEDPVLSRIAPDDCLAYFSWSGVAEADAKSKNQTEQLLAESEVREFADTLGKALSSAIKKGAPATPQGQVLGRHGPMLIHALLTHPTAIFLWKVEVGPKGPQFFGGAVVGTGNETEKIKAALEEIEKVITPENAAATQKWHRLPTPPDALHVDWAFEGKYLVFGIGPGTADGISARLTGKTPAWFTAMSEKLLVERVSTRFYLNAKKVIDLAAPLLGPDADIRQILDLIGVANLRTASCVSGLDKSGCVSKTWLETAGEPTGLLAVVGPEPLKAADLSAIPKDASFALAARLHPSKAYDAVLAAAKKVELDAAMLEQTESALGIRFKKDLLDTLGDTWCIYNSPGEGGLVITGLTIVAPVKDRERLAKSIDRLIDTLSDHGGPEGLGIKHTKFRGQQIFFLNSTSSELLPLAPAWCVSDTHLILSLSPQNVRAFLSRDRAAGTLADVPAVAERLKPGDAVYIGYQDTAGMLKITYPIVQILLNMGFSEMQREGLDVDAAMLPSLASLIRHVEPGISTLVREKNGLVYTSRRWLPVNLSLPMVLGATSFFGFAIQPIPPIIESSSFDRLQDTPPGLPPKAAPPAKSDAAPPPAAPHSGPPASPPSLGPPASAPN